MIYAVRDLRFRTYLRPWLEVQVQDAQFTTQLWHTRHQRALASWRYGIFSLRLCGLGPLTVWLALQRLKRLNVLKLRNRRPRFGRCGGRIRPRVQGPSAYSSEVLEHRFRPSQIYFDHLLIQAGNVRLPDTRVADRLREFFNPKVRAEPIHWMLINAYHNMMLRNWYYLTWRRYVYWQKLRSSSSQELTNANTRR